MWKESNGYLNWRYTALQSVLLWRSEMKNQEAIQREIVLCMLGCLEGADFLWNVVRETQGLGSISEGYVGVCEVLHIGNRFLSSADAKWRWGRDLQDDACNEGLTARCMNERLCAIRRMGIEKSHLSRKTGGITNKEPAAQSQATAP